MRTLSLNLMKFTFAAVMSLGIVVSSAHALVATDEIALDAQSSVEAKSIDKGASDKEATRASGTMCVSGNAHPIFVHDGACGINEVGGDLHTVRN